MTRKRCRRRRFDPEVNPVRLAMLPAAPIPAEELASLRTVELLSIAALTAGKATAQDKGTLRRMCLVSEALAGAGIGPEALPLVQAAREALARCGAAGAPADLAALRELLGVYDQQRDLASAADLERAIHRAVWGRARVR